jgi:class 3 adenylate cyclase
MSLALGVVLGALVLLAVASVMAVGIWSGYRNTLDLMGQKAEVMLSAAESQTRRYLDAAEDQLGFVAALVEAGEAAPGPDDEFTNLLYGALAAAPHIKAILYIDAAHNLVGAEQDADGVRPLYRRLGDDGALTDALEAARRDAAANASAGAWSGLAWREEYGQALLAYRRPVVVDGVFQGMLLSYISVRALSEFIADLESEFGNNAFVLHGRDAVLAHPLMAYGYPGLTGMNPLPRQSGFSDPVLASLWEPEARRSLAGLFEAAGGHGVALGAETYGFMYRELGGYSDRPLVIGTYFQSSDLLAEVLRLKWAAAACLMVLLLAVAAAALIGRRIATPARRLAEGARRIQALDLAGVPDIPGSFFKEIDDAARDFNAMRDGLAWFERYVPKTLVAQLMRSQGTAAIESREQVVTVMFTDIVGFTTLTEHLPAIEVAELLNHHFALIAGCVEAEGGTIDKFIGDSVMAIWGAPERQADAPERAARAALAIEAALKAANRTRRRDRKAPICLRIGIHCGPAVVGNIGSPGRINYTVVGDTVNTAQRLDELAREERGADQEVIIVVSGDTARQLAQDVHLDYRGLRQVRGRSRLIDVYALRARREPPFFHGRPAA